jgi:hypothetical protein
MTKSIANLAVLLIPTLCFSGQVLAQTQQWECAVNLQQGDTGTMSLSRDGDQVEGSITTVRNSNEFNSEIGGRWSDKVINLKRLLDSNSSEPMAGIVVTLGTEKVKIGGRFSSEYQGVWSADCDLVSSSSVTKERTNANESTDVAESSVPNPLVPSITSRVSPSKPSSKDKIKLSARASHPDGIASIAFFIGGKKVHTCDDAACEFDYGRLKKGKYNWYAKATSKSGSSNDRVDNELIVSSPLASTCNFRGFATGPAANLSLSYRVNLRGNGTEHSKSVAFKDLKYVITGVPKGNYTLTVDTQADPSVLWSPRSASVTCGSQSEVRQNFDFR